MYILGWEHIIVLGIAIVSLIVSATTDYLAWPDPEWQRRGQVEISVVVALFTIVVVIVNIINPDDIYTPGIWLGLALLIVTNVSLVIWKAHTTRHVHVPDLPEKTFTFPNGISFTYPGIYEVETEILDGIFHTASLKDMLKSKGYSKQSYRDHWDLSRLYKEWKNPQSTEDMYMTFSVDFFRSRPELTTSISDMYLREKDPSIKSQLTTIAGNEALLEEAYGFHGRDLFHRTATVLLGDYVVSVTATASRAGSDENIINECRAIAKGIENSLKFSGTPASERSFRPAASSYKPVQPQPLRSNINKNNKHYLVLGLQHGATQDEIHAAFLRMTEKYHPDKDSSLDAQMKFHEARQAYNALSNTTGAKNSELTAETWQPAHSDYFNDTSAGQSGYYDSSWEHGNYYPSLHDYFYRWRIVWAVVGSIVAIFIMMMYLTFLPSTHAFTHESSVRLFKHTAVFVFVSWLIFWCIRFTASHLRIAVIVLLGILYACWICFVALPTEFYYAWSYSRTLPIVSTMPDYFAYFLIFFSVFSAAMFSLE